MLSESLSTPCAHTPHNVDRRSREMAKAPHRPSHRAPLSTAAATTFNLVQAVMPTPRLVLWDTILGQTKKGARMTRVAFRVGVFCTTVIFFALGCDSGSGSSASKIDVGETEAGRQGDASDSARDASLCCGTPCVNSSFAACTATDLDCLCFSAE